ncbi:MAG: hypothetical protein Q8R79_04520 [Legionellaceae bacterium]|nr:hypothetical protein [Legionellaceae bacterium]
MATISPSVILAKVYLIIDKCYLKDFDDLALDMGEETTRFNLRYDNMV